jgi:hypothetical protein
MEKTMDPMDRAGHSVHEFPFFNAFNSQAMRLACWPLEMWLQWQAGMLRAAAPAAAEWLARRREGTEAALAALEQLCACERAEEASRIQSQWLEDERKRLETDLRAWTGPAAFWPNVTAARQARTKSAHA